MATRVARIEESIGLIAAVAAHAALLALLVWHPGAKPVIPPPESMTVTLSGETGLTATSPEPDAQPAPDVAPVIGESPEPEAALEPQPKPAPKVEARPETPPKVQPVAKPPPVTKPVPATAPVAKPLPRAPQPLPAAAQPLPRAPQPFPRAAPMPFPQARPMQPSSAGIPPRPVGASRVGNDFLHGIPGAPVSGAARNPPAPVIGPAVQSALSGAISRQLKPHWTAPQGVDAEKLVTILAWNLNPDGTLAGSPRLVRQEGLTEANSPQAARHAEQAVRAVQLSAPFRLPPDYYSAWQRVASFRFDKRLSQ